MKACVVRNLTHIHSLHSCIAGGLLVELTLRFEVHGEPELKVL
jgi:hypothetical protein